MNTLNYLSSLSSKKTGDTLTAEEWNNLTDAILKGANYTFDSLNTFTIESYANSTWTSVTYTAGTEVSLAVGGTYRLSGYTSGTTIKIEGATGAATTVQLNGVVMISNKGYNILYAPTDEKKSLIVDILPNTENYLIQENTDATYLTYGNIYSKNNVELIGSGYLGLFNSVGHGVRGSELKATGDIKYYIDVAHDALHGTKIADIHWGQYYINNAKDAIGSGLQDAEDAGKLRGIVRVFGGKFVINNLTDHTVFDAKYSCMKVEVSSDSETYTSIDESTDTTVEDFSTVYLIHSGIFSKQNVGIEVIKYDKDLVLFPATTFANNINYYREYLAKGTGKVLNDGVEVTATDNVYTCAGTTITVSGYINGTIQVTTSKAEVHLQRAYIEPVSGAAIDYTPTKKNVSVESNKYSESSYIAGQIKSGYNIKLVPKSGTQIYLRNTTDESFSCSKLSIGNGAGYLYACDNVTGLCGKRLYLGTEDDYDPTGTKADQFFSGAAYVFNNTKGDIYTVLDTNYVEGSGVTGDINSTVFVMPYNGGRFYVGTLHMIPSTGTEVAVDSITSATVKAVDVTGILTDQSTGLYYHQLECGRQVGATKVNISTRGALNKFF